MVAMAQFYADVLRYSRFWINVRLPKIITWNVHLKTPFWDRLYIDFPEKREGAGSPIR